MGFAMCIRCSNSWSPVKKNRWAEVFPPIRDRRCPSADARASLHAVAFAVCAAPERSARICFASNRPAASVPCGEKPRESRARYFPPGDVASRACSVDKAHTGTASLFTASRRVFHRALERSFPFLIRLRGRLSECVRIRVPGSLFLAPLFLHQAHLGGRLPRQLLAVSVLPVGFPALLLSRPLAFYCLCAPHLESPLFHAFPMCSAACCAGFYLSSAPSRAFWLAGPFSFAFGGIHLPRGSSAWARGYSHGSRRGNARDERVSAPRVVLS